MLHLTSLAVVTLLAAGSVSTPPPAPNLTAPPVSSLTLASTSDLAQVLPAGGTPGWLLLAACTEGSFQWVNTGECCGLSRTLSIRQQCVNGVWVNTSTTHCSLPLCEF